MQVFYEQIKKRMMMMMMTLHNTCWKGRYSIIPLQLGINAILLYYSSIP